MSEPVQERIYFGFANVGDKADVDGSTFSENRNTRIVGTDVFVDGNGDTPRLTGTPNQFAEFEKRLLQTARDCGLTVDPLASSG